jgi:hypothetical protein
MCESVSLVGSKNKVLNKFITDTEELNRGYTDVVPNVKKIRNRKKL